MGKIPGRGNCNVPSGKAGGGMEPVNWEDFTKANMARTQRVRQQWEREKAAWARPYSVL